MKKKGKVSQNLLDIIVVVSCCWKYANVLKSSSLFKEKRTWRCSVCDFVKQLFKGQGTVPTPELSSKKCRVFYNHSQKLVNVKTCQVSLFDWFITSFLQVNHVQKWLTTTENTITYHCALCLSLAPKFRTSIVFSFSWELKWPQDKLKTMLMQNFGVTNKEHYCML